MPGGATEKERGRAPCDQSIDVNAETARGPGLRAPGGSTPQSLAHVLELGGTHFLALRNGTEVP